MPSHKDATQQAFLDEIRTIARNKPVIVLVNGVDVVLIDKLNDAEEQRRVLNGVQFVNVCYENGKGFFENLVQPTTSAIDEALSLPRGITAERVDLLAEF
jgi:hypothetical protein